ncbi:hypothetical protein ACWCZ5_26140 [Streptomyces sp. NPDC001667]
MTMTGTRTDSHVHGDRIRPGHRPWRRAPGGRTRIFTPGHGAGRSTWGNTISIRHALAAALVVSGALTLTACGPDDGGKASSGPSSSASPARSAAPAGPADSGRSKDPCGPLPKGHKLVRVDHVEGAMANVIAQDAKVSCNTKMDEGAFYRPDGPTKTYSFDPQAKVTVIGKNGPEARPAANTGTTLSGIGHVKECADPDHKQYDSGQSKQKSDEYCAGQNYYDVAVGPDNKITEMTELYGS